MRSYILPEVKIKRDKEKCIECQVCIRQCAFEAHKVDADGSIKNKDEKCVACYRCVTLCPTQALTIEKNEQYVKKILFGLQVFKEISGSKRKPAACYLLGWGTQNRILFTGITYFSMPVR